MDCISPYDQEPRRLVGKLLEDGDACHEPVSELSRASDTANGLDSVSV